MVPESFERALQSFDPLLSVRESSFLPGKWIIDRVGHIPPAELWYLNRRRDRIARFLTSERGAKKLRKLQHLYPQVAEEFDSARAGKRVVLIADQLDRRIFDALALADTRQYGGYSRFIDEMDKRQRDREASLERELAQMRDELHSETHDKLNFAWRHKDTALAHYDGRQKLSELIR